MERGCCSEDLTALIRSDYLSFDHFYKTYTKDQTRNDERLKELEREMKEVQKHSDP